METVAVRDPGSTRPRPCVSVNAGWVTGVLAVCVLGYNAVGVYRTAMTVEVAEKFRCGPGSAGSRFVAPLTNSTEPLKGFLKAGDWLFMPGEFWEEDGVTRACPCLRAGCFFKCCPLGQMLVSSTNLTCDIPSKGAMTLSYFSFINLISISTPLNTIKKRYDDSSLFLFDNLNCDANVGIFGSRLKELPVDEKGMSVEIDKVESLTDDWCNENTNSDNMKFMVLNCAENTYLDILENATDKLYVTINLFGFLISTLCFTITIEVYSIYPVHRNLQGMLLLSYFASLTLNYTWFFIRLIIDTYFYKKLSSFVGVLMYVRDLLSLASISWLTVICFNMWLVFGALPNPRSASQSNRTFLKYLLYSAFGWGIPIIICVLKYFVVDCFYISQCNTGEIWYSSDKSIELFLNIPKTIMWEMNVVLFLTMLCNLRSHSCQTQELSEAESQTHGQTKEAVLLYIKLALTTGLVSLLMRVLVSKHIKSFSVLGYTTVTLFHYQGLILFIVLALDNSVWSSAKAIIVSKL